jgi:D-lactate dehydrogenase
MPAPSILFLEVDAEDAASVRKHFPDVDIVERVLEGDALVQRAENAAVISCFIHTPFPAEVLRALPKLRLLCTRSVGYDHIDLHACHSMGVMVCNVPDYGSHVIAEHVFALLLSTLRHVPEADTRVHRGVFDYHGLRGMALRGKTIGIVGTGKIGRHVAAIAHGFGMNILAVDTCRTLEIVERFGVRYVSFDVLLAASDIVTLHVPASKETEHMINDAAIAAMRPGSVIVNTARGSLIDSTALLKGLESGKIAHALLDVLEHEQNFTEHRELITHPRVVTTPHIAFYADDSMRNMYLDTFQSIDQWNAGQEPDHVVHPLRVVCDLPGVRKA